MKDRVFVDSNVWCYSLDPRSGEKQAMAKRAIHELALKGSVVISTQVANEVFAVATRKLGIPAIDAKNVLRNMFLHETVTVDQAIIGLAIDFCLIEQISYWDALMLAAASSANCSVLLTEDMSSGSILQGVRIQNPFLMA